MLFNKFQRKNWLSLLLVKNIFVLSCQIITLLITNLKALLIIKMYEKNFLIIYQLIIIIIYKTDLHSILHEGYFFL